MRAAAKTDQAIASVTTFLNYLVDTGEKPVTYSNAGGPRITTHTGKYEKRSVTIHNGRLNADEFTLEREGFVLVGHETQVANFYDDEEVRAVYYPEMERLVKKMTGAEKVLIFDHTLRAENDTTRQEKQVGAPVRNVHNDYTEWSGPQRVRDLLPAQEAAERLQRRFAVVQV